MTRVDFSRNGRMRVAAYQAPLLLPGCMDALELIRVQVRRCEAERIRILCCPEAILGGLADNLRHPSRFAIATDTDMLRHTLSPLASDTVTSIVGFSELGDGGRVYNSAAVFQRGEIAGLYRKLYPAIRRSVYSPGLEIPVFRIEELSFGIVICNDSNYPELAGHMAEQGATALFVPTNNGLPPKSARADLIVRARKRDMATAVENNMWIIRADVAGNAGGLVSFGSSGIVDPEGIVVQSARQMREDLVVADIDTIPRVRQWRKKTSPSHLSTVHSGSD
jgi:5-aminopentanamidase